MPAPKPKEPRVEQDEPDEVVEQRRDDALRRALNTPPKRHPVARDRTPDERRETDVPKGRRA